jgi:hypothetical protein
MQNDERRTQNEEGVVLCLVRDLLFYSKIRAAAANTAGIVLKNVRDPAKLAGEVGSGLIVDLNQPEALAAAAQWLGHSGKPVVGFVSHVDADTIQAAKAAGVDQVVPRSQFEKNLSRILYSLRSVPSIDQQNRTP